MAIMTVSQLREGMVLIEDAYTASGSQMILPRGTRLDAQRIARLAFYGVKQVNAIAEQEAAAQGIESPDVTPVSALPAAPAIARPGAPEPSFGDRVKASPEFKKFKMDFEDAFISYQRNINEVIRTGKPLDMHAMTEPVYDLIHSCYGPSNVFDMLHQLRDYDDATYAHSINVALIAHNIGEWMHLEEDDLELLTQAGLLHDIGKVTLPHELLNKQGDLTNEEKTRIRMHPQFGYKAIENQKINQHVKNTVLMHHERNDGSGYPRHLKMDQIDPVAKIVAIADVYDAMTSTRSYRKALSPFFVIEYIEEDALQKYDAQAVLTFLENISGAYVGNRVRLSDGTEGEIIYVNKNRFSCPTIRSGAEFIDLDKRRELKIEALI
ncbi:MAG: HD-GYP domain-containing protein [Lachnospiraceae bacterium]|nr:HD-GYP domain-containing protein [Lachnospiraceae bacterium]